jgi:DNA-directed RNA polymerase I, II, and III subunit RPABC1
MDLDTISPVICELLTDREYIDIVIEDDIITATKPNNEMIHVYFINQKLNISVMKSYYSIMRINNVTHVILIYTSSITASAKKILENMSKIKIELFHSDSFQLNITKHRLVPKHTQVSKTDVKELNSYPTIKTIDPIVKYYGFERGSLIKIDRHDGSIYYRVVRDSY